MFIKEILSAKGNGVITVRPDASLVECASLLTEKKIGVAVVCDAVGKVVGVIAVRDVVRALAEFGAGAAARPVSGLMSRDVVSCAPGDGLQKVMEKMNAHGVRHLPVMEDGQLVGFVSIGDLLKYLSLEAKVDEEALRAYVSGVGY